MPDASVATIERDEIRRRLGDPTLILVNVLSPEGYAQARIPGSRSLPLDELESRADAILPDRDADIAIYCGGPT